MSATRMLLVKVRSGVLFWLGDAFLYVFPIHVAPLPSLAFETDTDLGVTCELLCHPYNDMMITIAISFTA